MADNLPDVYLRFTGADPDVRGESMDAAYPAEDNWLPIKSFNFGFGWGGSSDSGQHDDALRKVLNGQKLSPARQNELIKNLQNQRSGANGSSGGSHGQAHQTGGTLKQKEFSFTKTPGPASKDILSNLRKATPIDEVELIVCRAAGVDVGVDDDAKDAKIPFLRLVFEEVYITKCGVQVSKDQPPAESIEFWFNEAKLQTIWTDNATGQVVPGSKLTASFDFGTKKGRGHNEDDSWDEEA